MMSSRVFFSIVVFSFCVVYSLAEIQPDAETILINTARNIRNRTRRQQNIKNLGQVQVLLESDQRSEYKTFVSLLQGFDAIDCGDIEEVQRVQNALQCETLAPWEIYMSKMLSSMVSIRQTNQQEVLNSIEWLCANTAKLENGKRTSKLCMSLCEGLEKGKGSLEAGLLISKAGHLTSMGRLEEAQTVYQSVVTNYPNTGWAISARNRRNHLKNEKAIAKIMEKQYKPTHNQK